MVRKARQITSFASSPSPKSIHSLMPPPTNDDDDSPALVQEEAAE
eukprot:CAMPEP_0185725570 /NCGR_PEP_ID=MMETSP1171-20130828/1797_1 /TAXON_ID=374046 /ORGANISM="Helicotheca tamensis, Strain CCMP826" /LENGTH=44 /DNA_ID= /DNA_START= /DNA_END= /DNA_ORIENTATION=